MNSQSSRSHCIIVMNVKLRCRNVRGEVEEKSSTVHFVDLAGNEKLNRIAQDPAPGDKMRPMSRAKDNYEQLMKECRATNSSLSTLNKCIDALAKDGIKHVPYRESMLTKVLQESLGGDAKLVVIGTIASTQTNRYETLMTLRNMSQAKNITNHKNEIARQIAREKRRLMEESEGTEMKKRLPDAYFRRVLRVWMVKYALISSENAEIYANKFVGYNIRSLKDICLPVRPL